MINNLGQADKAPDKTIMNGQNNAPASDEGVNNGQATPVAPEVTNDSSGQGTGDAVQSPQSPTKTFDERFSEFRTKKGWDNEKGLDTLLTSYEELESKLGNWSDVERKAKDFDSLNEQSLSWKEKAQMWDEAQERYAMLEQEKKIQAGELDLNKVPVQTLASLWKQGQVSMADLPPQRQYEVQKFAQEQDIQLEQAAKAEASSLIERHSIPNDPKVLNLIADYIDKGMDPDKAAQEVKSFISYLEKKGETRLKEDIEMVKNGNMERSSSAAPTKPKRVIKSVRDAFLAAKEDLNDN